MNVNVAHVGLQKTITWTKNQGKGGKNGNGLMLKAGCDIKIKNSCENKIC